MSESFVTAKDLESSELKAWIKISEELDKREERRHEEYLRHNDSIQKMLSDISDKVSENKKDFNRILNERLKEYATKEAFKNAVKRIDELEKNKKAIITLIIGAVIAALLKLII